MRGFLSRNRNYGIVLKIKEARHQAYFRKSKKDIERLILGHAVRFRIRKWHKAAFRIQGYQKMRWLSRLFQQVRYATHIIQRNVRTYLAYRHIIN